MRVNLGCNDDLLAGWVNVDRAAPADLIADLDAVWPWAFSSVDEIRANDVFEHLRGPGHVAPKIWCMNEAWRVLRPGGRLAFQVPCFHLADGRVNPGAIADPTHVSFWTVDDRYYFGEQWNNPQGERGRLGPAYGITALFRGEWVLVEYGAGPERRAKLRADLRAIK